MTTAERRQRFPTVRVRPQDMLPAEAFQGEIAPNGKPWSVLCGALRRQGEEGARCMAWAGTGTDHVGFGTCSQHFGNGPGHVIKADRLQAERWFNMRLGELEPEASNVDYLLMLSEEVRRTYAAVKILDAQVQLLAPEEWAGMMETEEITSSTEGSGTGATGRDTSQRTAQIKRTSRVHWWVDRWYHERKHLLDVVKIANQVHLSTRQLEFMETEALAIADLFMATFSDPELGLTDEQIDHMKRVAYKHMTAMPGKGMDVLEVSGR